MRERCTLAVVVRCRVRQAWKVPLVVVAVVAFGSPAARAATVDNEPPEITPEPVKLPAPGKPLAIECDIADKSDIFDPLVYWRGAGQKEFARTQLKHVSGTRYRAEIVVPPAIKELEYVLEAFDANGNGPARVGNQNKPMRLSLEPPKAPPKVVKVAPVVPSGPSNVPAYAALGAGGVLVVVGVVFALSAGTAHDEFVKNYDPVRRPELASSIGTDALIADVGIGLGLAGVATGAFLLLRGSAATPADSESDELPVVVLPSLHGLLVRAEF
jgi:hypothetical protein